LRLQLQDRLAAGTVMLALVSIFGFWWPNGFLALAGSGGALVSGTLWLLAACSTQADTPP
jgi:hypothetical protein